MYIIIEYKKKIRTIQYRFFYFFVIDYVVFLTRLFFVNQGFSCIYAWPWVIIHFASVQMTQLINCCASRCFVHSYSSVNSLQCCRPPFPIKTLMLNKNIRNLFSGVKLRVVYNELQLPLCCSLRCDQPAVEHPWKRILHMFINEYLFCSDYRFFCWWPYSLWKRQSGN